MKIKSLLIALLIPCLFIPAFANAEQANKIEANQTPKDALLTFILDKAKSYSGTLEQNITKAVDFAKEEAPIVVKEFLIWKSWESAIKGFIIPFIWVASLILAYLVRNKMDVLSIMLPIIATTVTFVTAPLWISNIMGFIQIQVAPRIYLIEYAMKTLGNH